MENDTAKNKAVVRAFFRDIRSGANLGAVADYLAPAVTAHQVCSEEPLDVERTPQNYAEHVAEMIGACDGFSITLDAVLADEALVYARWTQRGVYAVRDEDGGAVRRPITEFASAVYRLDAGKIVEYWIQVDRFGTLRQLQQL